MRVVGVIGPGSDDVAGALVRTLQDRGTVARVRGGDVSADGGTLVESAAGAETEYVVGESGVRVSGPPRPLSTVLDDLAPDHQYAVVTDHPASGLPHVIVGDVEFEGDELARLDSPESSIQGAIRAIEALEPRETLGSLVAEAKASPAAARAGALATFTGRVREVDSDDDVPTAHLEFETYEEVAEERMAKLEAELEARDGVYEVVMHHKTGVVEAGEDIVFVVVLAGHREEAFATVSDGIDRLKAEVPIFKKEVTLDGEFWAHERE